MRLRKNSNGETPLNVDNIESDLDGSVNDDEVEELGALHDFDGYSGDDAADRMKRRRENLRGHKTGAFTDIGEGRSGVTRTKLNL